MFPYREEGRGPGTPADLQIRKWFAEILNMGGLHGKGGGAEEQECLPLLKEEMHSSNQTSRPRDKLHGCNAFSAKSCGSVG